MAAKIQDGVIVLIIDRLDLDDHYHLFVGGKRLYARSVEGVNWMLAEWCMSEGGFGARLEMETS